ncbi:putative zinc finger protein [Microdochium bolleyi]|uniref:Putative zinc finger protein n=1 Tax=Microdochium bolleyi TaxID=196109 RepID=A0A136ITP4_9PEZI|nr:putative zinc finger protein [Microdochium bolleyi]
MAAHRHDLNAPPPLRRLLPAKPDEQESPPSRPPAAEQRPTVACWPCRQAKAKCDARRPECTRCISKKKQCHYETNGQETRTQARKRKFETLQSRQDNLEYVVEALRSRPDPDADAILWRLRKGDAIDALANRLRHGDLLLQLSLVPETRYRYEFPLLRTMPTSLRQRTNPYLQSQLYEWVVPDAHVLPSPQPPPSHSQWPEGPRIPQAPFLMPYHAAEVIDVALDSVQPSKWTTVGSDDALMRKLLGAFLLQDWSWFPVFHRDYFLQDMAAMSHELCSPLLVNVVLAAGCNYYRDLGNRAEFWNPSTYGYRFLAEARRLWEIAQTGNDLTTIQAGMVFHIIYNLNGADRLGYVYTIRACQMAHEIGLFKRSGLFYKQRLRNARDFTAWNLFLFQSLCSFTFYRAPILKETPDVPLPSPLEDPKWYGELLLRYPLSQTPYNANFAQYFNARIEYEKIMNDLGVRLFTSKPGTRPLSATETAEFYLRFRGWYHQLPGSLSPRNIVLSCALKLHMRYHHELLGILTSMLTAETPGSPAAVFAEQAGQSPHQLFLHSKICLETLLRVYYLRHGFEYLDAYLIAFLSTGVFMSIRDMELSSSSSSDKLLEMRSTVILLSKGVYDQGSSLFLGKLLFRLIRSRIRAEDLDALQRFAKFDDAELARQEEHLEQATSQWPVDIVSKTDNPDVQRLSLLLQRHKLEASKEPRSHG